MIKKIWLAASVLLMLSMGFAGVAEAADFHGTGSIWAKGSGVAYVRGDGVVEITCYGVGTVRVKGADVISAQGTGRRWDLPDGTVVFAGWRGDITIEGDALAVKMAGGLIEFTAEGTGSVYLKGHGVYIVNGETGSWTTEGVRLDLATEAELQ